MSVERIGGANRYETATKIADRLSQLLGPINGWRAFLTNGENFPDALAAAPMAALYGFPILFTPPKGDLHPATKKWLSKRKSPPGQDPFVVYALGSTASVPKVAANTAKKVSGAEALLRLAGENRYETAVAINGTFGPLRPDIVTIATGRNFPDALAGGAFAAKLGAPLYLIDGQATKADPSVRFAFYYLQQSQYYVFGGTASVSDAALDLHLDFS